MIAKERVIKSGARIASVCCKIEQGYMETSPGCESLLRESHSKNNYYKIIAIISPVIVYP
jgi:hypothetical protein